MFWKSRTRRENEAAQSRYKTFVEQQGELFEDKKEPLTQEDIQDIERRKKRLDRHCLIGIVAVVALATFFLIITPTPNYVEDFGFVLFWGFIIGGMRYIVHRQFDKALTANQKRVVQGVITAKIYTDYKWYFEMSNKVRIQARKADYKKHRAGDILRIEMLSEDVYTNRKLVKLGTI
jgi:hypothetical protein